MVSFSVALATAWLIERHGDCLLPQSDESTPLFSTWMTAWVDPEDVPSPVSAFAARESALCANAGCISTDHCTISTPIIARIALLFIFASSRRTHADEYALRVSSGSYVVRADSLMKARRIKTRPTLATTLSEQNDLMP